MRSEISSFHFGDMFLSFVTDESHQIGLTVVPFTMRNQILVGRSYLMGDPAIDVMPGASALVAREVDSLVQIHFRGDPATSGFSQGRTMRASPSTRNLRFVAQEVVREQTAIRVLTTLRASNGVRIVHECRYLEGASYFSTLTHVFNETQVSRCLDLLSSVSLSGVSPFDAADSPNRIVVHRVRSSWSAEARPVSERLEDLHLERSWSGASVLAERFGQVGSMPTRGWFPFLAVEDIQSNVTWAVEVGWPGSWQLELSRQHDEISLSGGLADREFGHWAHTLNPGESFTSPEGVVTCVAGNADSASDRLREWIEPINSSMSGLDSLVTFNEWCSTWGKPTHATSIALATAAAAVGVDCFVIDAGWYRPTGPNSDWANSHGEWIANPVAFPAGLHATAAEIRRLGLIPGIWLEPETVGAGSAAFHDDDTLLTRDDVPITVGSRRFLDLRNPQVAERLLDLVKQLNADGFGYLKIDYNETIGIGVDHPDGLGEGLRLSAEASLDWFRRISRELPTLITENCASGGHRLEPSLISVTSLSSFSDAHEVKELPIIAASLHRVVPASKLQIWAVLRETDDLARTRYSLCAVFLGRPCLSGEIDRLSEAALELVRDSIRIYRESAHTLLTGTSRLFGDVGASRRHPSGWQCVVRLASDGTSCVLVAHLFDSAPSTLEVPLPEGEWSVSHSIHEPEAELEIRGHLLTASGTKPFTAFVAILQRH